jgi:hypothetical protein
MARGKDERNNDARIVNMRQWVMRNHPSVAGGGAGKKPPTFRKTAAGGADSPFERLSNFLFPESKGYKVENQPEYKGQQGRISDLNPRNNPMIYKFDDEKNK